MLRDVTVQVDTLDHSVSQDFAARRLDSGNRNWAEKYAARSIRKSREYGSEIYKLEKNGEVFYAYARAKKGDNDEVDPGLAPKKYEVVADIHSHGAYEYEYDNSDGHMVGSRKDFNNTFSGGGWVSTHDFKIPGYLTTPNGSLPFLPYVPDVMGQKNVAPLVIDTNLSSDPNDPTRKNKIDP